MTDEQRTYWQGYIEQMRGLLRLSHWEIDVTDAPPQNDEATASIYAEPQRNNAEIHFAAQFFTDTPEHQRYCLTHELMHLHLWRYMQYANGVTDHLGGQARMLVGEQLGALMELANDEIAKAVAPFLPLPPKPKKERA